MVWTGELHDIWNEIITWSLLVASRTRGKYKLQFNCACSEFCMCVNWGIWRVGSMSCGRQKWLNSNSIQLLTINWMWVLNWSVSDWHKDATTQLWLCPHCANISHADFFCLGVPYVPGIRGGSRSVEGRGHIVRVYMYMERSNLRRCRYSCTRTQTE